MTVIIALKDKEKKRVILGADGQGTSDDIKLNFGCKIFNLKIPLIKTEEDMEIIDEEDVYFLISGTHYLETYLKNAFNPPSKVIDEEFINYLYNQFFQSLSNELSTKYLLKFNEGALESEAGLIIVYKDNLYNVYSDFSIVEETNDFTVHGSGWKIATGVLTNLLNNHTDMDKEEMVREALLTTGELNIYCNKNIVVETIPF